MRFKLLTSALLIACAGAVAPALLAQDKPAQDKPVQNFSAPAAEPANLETKQLAKSLIEQLLQTTHAADIFDDLRRTLKNVYIPTIKDLVQGDVPGAPQPDAKTAAAMAKLLTFLTYANKAGDELNVALAENKEAMISDFADQIAKTANPPELKDVENILQLPAVRKALDAFFAASKLVTGFSYDEGRTFADFTAWASRLNFTYSQLIPGAPGTGQGVPSQRKIAKAQAFVEDFLKLSHLDDMVSDVRRFAREVYAETAPMSEEDREELRDKIDQYEFNYTLQKAIVIAAAPSVVASALTDEQLATLHGFLRSPAFVKAFDRLREAVHSATSFTKKDILDAQKSIEDLERKAKLRERGLEEQEKAKKEWDALVTKWKNTLKDRLSPDTREGLERSLEDLKSNGSPI